MGECGAVRWIISEYPERGAIESVKSILSRDPIKSLPVLQDMVNFIGRKTLRGGDVFEYLIGGLGYGLRYKDQYGQANGDRQS